MSSSQNIDGPKLLPDVSVESLLRGVSLHDAQAILWNDPLLELIPGPTVKTVLGELWLRYSSPIPLKVLMNDAELFKEEVKRQSIIRWKRLRGLKHSFEEDIAWFYEAQHMLMDDDEGGRHITRLRRQLNDANNALHTVELELEDHGIPIASPYNGGLTNPEPFSQKGKGRAFSDTRMPADYSPHSDELAVPNTSEGFY